MIIQSATASSGRNASLLHQRPMQPIARRRNLNYTTPPFSGLGSRHNRGEHSLPGDAVSWNAPSTVKTRVSSSA